MILPWHHGGYYVKQNSNMKTLPIRLIMMWLLVICTPASAEVTVDDLVHWANYSAIDNQLAKADIDVLQQQLKIDQANQGLNLFLGSGFGNNRAVISNTSTLTYQSANMQLGLTLPLLGSAEKLEKKVMNTELSLKLAQINHKRIEGDVLNLLFTANAQLYYAEERIQFDNSFLSRKDNAKKILSYRLKEHYLLKSRQLDFDSMFDIAKRELIKNEAEKSEAMLVLQELTEKTLTTYQPQAPTVSPPTDLEKVLSSAAQSAASVKSAEAVLAASENSAEKLNWEGINGNLILSQSLTKGIGVPSGFATTIGVQVDMPIDILHERSVIHREKAALIDQAQLSLRKAQLKANQDTQIALNNVQKSDMDTIASWRQLEAAFSAWQIAHLRAQAIPDDAIEKDLKKTYLLYQAAINYSYSQELLAKNIIHAENFEGKLSANKLIDKEQSETSNIQLENIQNNNVNSALNSLKHNWKKVVQAALYLGHKPIKTISNRSAKIYGWYTWNAADFIREWHNNEKFLYQTRRVELSFTPSQMQTIMELHKLPGLANFLEKAKDMGITVNWLIGEPDLVTANGRRKLMQWLPAIYALGFDGVDLDVERSQLPKNKQNIWKSGIIKTIAVIHSETGRPITLTINYKEFKNKNLINQLIGAGLSNAAIMIYISNPNRVKQIVIPILQKYSNLSISIVQSIEPGLPAVESLYPQGQSAAMTHWQNLSRSLNAFPNFDGIDIQSWEDFYKAKP